MIFDSPHRRFDPLHNEWVLVSPQRTERPWLGQTENAQVQLLPTYDPSCYLCPGNERARGIRNADYKDIFVFDNDFPSLLPDLVQEDPGTGHPLLAHTPERGLCRVVCFSPRHDLTLPELEIPAIVGVIHAWINQTTELSAKDFIANVQVFENKGEIMGCSNPHPHSQIWAQSHVPNENAKELSTQSAYFARHQTGLLIDYGTEELRRGDRLVSENDHFIGLVPFWAIWPFEILVTAKRPTAYLTDLTPDEITDLADILKNITIRYDNLFRIPFPYSMGFHQAPFDGFPHPEWTLHAHFYPPLLRSAEVRKFMVGYEMLAMPQRDITPESAADRLRTTSPIHYKQMDSKE